MNPEHRHRSLPRQGWRRPFPSGCRLGIAALVGLLSATTAAHALDPSRAVSQYAHRQWRLEQGLPQNTVRAITQTQDGLLVVATHAGLAWFDGVRFDRIDGEGYEFLERHHAYALTTDGRGTLWIGTTGGGLFGRRSDGSITPFEHNEELPSLQIAALAADGEHLWIGTEDSGLALADPRGLRLWGPEQGLGVGTIHGLAPDGHGGVWATTLGDGLYHVTEQGVVGFGIEHGLPSEMIWSVLQSPDGRIWVGTDHGLAVGTEGRWRRVARAPRPAGNAPSATEPGGDDASIPIRARALALDRQGLLWIGTMGRGLWRLGNAGLEPMSLDDEASQEVVWSVFADRENHLWYGSLGGGLHQVFDAPGVPFGWPEGLVEQRPLSVIEDPEGHLLITTRSSGLQRLQPGAPAHGKTERITVDDGLSSNGSWGLDFDAEGNLWIATMAPGIDRIRPDGRIDHFDTGDGLGQGRMLSVKVLSDGTVWAATASGPSRFDGERFHTFGVEDGLVHAQAQYLAEGSEGRLWIGTNGGISIYHRGRFTNISESEGLRNSRIWTLLPEEGHDGWAGTFGGGLHAIVDGEVALVINQLDGLPNNDITSLVDDGRGYLWIGTTAGVARVPWTRLRARLAEALLAKEEAATLGSSPSYDPNRIDLAIETFDGNNGLRSAELYGGQPMGIRDRRGRLWFTTLDGLVSFDPAALGPAVPPVTLIRNVRLGGRSTDARQKLIVPPGPRSIEIDFTAASLRAPTRTQFRYRAPGIDEDWRQIGSRRSVELSRLPPGEYRFEVEASDARGRFAGRPTTLELVIEPRFIETRTFYILIAFFLIGLGVTFGQWRARLSKAREKELARAVAEAVSRVRTLRGMLPICASCKNIRDDDGYWQKIESYLDDHSEARFSHGLCPNCSERYMHEVEAAENRPVEQFETVAMESTERKRTVSLRSSSRSSIPRPPTASAEPSAPEDGPVVPEADPGPQRGRKNRRHRR